MNVHSPRGSHVLVLAFSFLLAAATSPAQQQPTKHPKLSTPLAELAQAVPQHTGAVAQGQQITAPPGFSVEGLPKSLRDAIRARQMHITKNAEVQASYGDFGEMDSPVP